MIDKVTNESTRATTAPDRLGAYLEAALFHLKNEKYRDAKGCVEKAVQLNAVQPSPSTGGEPAPRDYDCYNCGGKESAHHEGCQALKVAGGGPATDSAGLPAGFITHDTFLKLSLGQVAEILPPESGADPQKIAVYFRPSAACEPAPVARELDVEAELLDAAKAFYNATVADTDVLIRANSAHKRDAVTTAGERLRTVMLACTPRQSTAESAPASAAPNEQPKKLAHGHRDDFYLMANARILAERPIHAIRSMPNWVLARELFATGASSANQICIEAGIDPDGYKVERAPSNSSPVGAKEQDK